MSTTVRKKHLEVPRTFGPAYREGRFGKGAPTPFLGYLFLLEDRSNVKQPVTNKEPYFKVDPAFRGLPAPSKVGGTMNYQGVTYAERYELLCRRLVLERIYNASCFMMATNAQPCHFPAGTGFDLCAVRRRSARPCSDIRW